MITKVDHIAVAVRDLERALVPYREALGLTPSEIEDVPDQKVRIAFLPVGQTRGEGLHHICLQVDDLETTLASLKAQGVQLIDEEPRDGGQGKRIAFVHPRSMGGVLLELTEG